jgi:hypothetical protein
MNQDKSEYMIFTFFYGFCFKICPMYLIQNILRRDPEFLEDTATNEGFADVDSAIQLCMKMKLWSKERLLDSMKTCPSPNLKRFVLEHLV